MVNKMKLKPVIITITGESGVGKTLVAEYIEKVYLIKMIQSYTDRAPRYEGENGHTFITKEEFDKFKEEDMIALTNFGSYRYCCLQQDVLPINTYVIDEKGIDFLESRFSDKYKIIKIRLHRDLELRKPYVTPERINRDIGMYYKTDKDYDCIIKNNNSKEDLYRYIDIVLNDILRQLKW